MVRKGGGSCLVRKYFVHAHYALAVLVVTAFSLRVAALRLAAVAWSSTFFARLLSVLSLWILQGD
jgi:hypothetical protein